MFISSQLATCIYVSRLVLLCAIGPLATIPCNSQNKPQSQSPVCAEILGTAHHGHSAPLPKQFEESRRRPFAILSARVANQAVSTYTRRSGGDLPVVASPSPDIVVPIPLAQLSPEARRDFLQLVVYCSEGRSPPIDPVEAFLALENSQEACYAAVVQALETTHIVGADGSDLGPAWQIVERVTVINGALRGRPSEEQFQIYVLLKPNALFVLRQAANFLGGRNHVYHRDYPISFRQKREKRTLEMRAGLHISLSENGQLAQIHVDYRFGLRHLYPDNSDVRAEGNYEEHVARWPGLSEWWSQQR